jgi:hypothetical protein
MLWTIEIGVPNNDDLKECVTIIFESDHGRTIKIETGAISTHIQGEPGLLPFQEEESETTTPTKPE